MNIISGFQGRRRFCLGKKFEESVESGEICGFLVCVEHLVWHMTDVNPGGGI